MYSNIIRKYFGENALHNVKQFRAGMQYLSRGRSNEVSKLLKDIDITTDEGCLKFLITLHDGKFFPKVNLSNIYETKTLLDRATLKLNRLKALGCLQNVNKALELGSGNGEMLYVEGFDDVNLTCCDYRIERHKTFEAKVLSNGKCGQFIELDIENNLQDIEGSFDLVFSSSVMEHFRSPESTIKKIYNKLSPGGMLYADFATFGAPYAIHRKIFTGIPYIQAFVPDHVAFEFFYNHLGVNEGLDRYTDELVVNNPYPEVNRLMLSDWKILIENAGFEFVELKVSKFYKFKWFVDLLKIDNEKFPKEDLFMGELILVARKPN